MANAYKRLAALRPADTNEAELYEVPGSTEAVVTINICNQDSVSHTYDIALTDVDGAASGEDWIISNKPIDAFDTHQITGIAMAAGNTIRVVASIADKISFVAWGMEVT